MPTLDNLAARFAQCVSLFRDPSAKTEQKKEFRALLGLLQETAVTLRLAPGGSGIELNGVPCEGAGVAGLGEGPAPPRLGGNAPPPDPPPGPPVGAPPAPARPAPGRDRPGPPPRPRP